MRACREVGVDEAGRGPLAGPVVAAAVWLNETSTSPIPLADSKKLSKLQREKLYGWLKGCGAEIGVGIVEHGEIDEINIHNASLLAMKRAVESMKLKPDKLLIDGKFTIDMEVEQEAVIKGDQKVPAISAASIIAKVTRDAIMERYHLKYPLYGFAKHMGYPTVAHRKAVLEHGPCEIHRKSFRGVKGIC